MGFYGTADLIGWCQERGWDYRLRLKGNLVVFDGSGKTTTGQCARDRVHYLEDVKLTGRRARTHIGIIRDPGHAEPSGSSRCLKNQDTCARLSMLIAGASSRCSPTSNRAASALRTPTPAPPTASTA